MSNKTESIIADIMTLDSHYEIEQVIQAIKLKRTYLEQQAKRKFVAGDKVEFDSRNGNTMKGTIEGIKVKYILVKIDGLGMRYNVPASMLRRAA